ncbi:Aromatic-L-amino-acid decarboxylase-like protein [Aphelenchoides besseyi]|nr:Aromatic-L-amino-acid decarboxylase-like protein [Aphelenchoides besseyi]
MWFLLVCMFGSCNALTTMRDVDHCPVCGSQWSAMILGIVIGLLGMYWFGQEKKGSISPKNGMVRNEIIAPDIQTNELPMGKYGAREVLLPMRSEQMRQYMNQIVELIVEYVRNPQKYKVLTEEKFGFIYKKLPKQMPDDGEDFNKILADVYEKLLPGLLHWQHPQFHGYFACANSYPDLLADALINGLSVVPFAYISAPSIFELEMVVVNWFARALGLPQDFQFAEDAATSKGGGIISRLFFLMAARTRKLRELISDDHPNRREAEAHLLPRLVAYASSEAHSSIEKAALMAMIRIRPVRPSEDHFGLNGQLLQRQIKKDLAEGNIPFYIHGSLGTTNTSACDNLEELGKLAAEHKCWFHVDMAYGGNALICPEFRYLAKGIELVDSINCNMHKMLLCSVPMSFMWCRHKQHIEKAFAVHPAYLKDKSKSPNLRHWGIPLSRRSLCLKGWFVMRTFGLNGMREHVRRMVKLADQFRTLIKNDGRFEFVGNPILTLTAFRLRDSKPEEANRLTLGLCEYLNRSNRIFVTHAKPMNIDVIRVNMSFNLANEEDVNDSYQILSELTEEFLAENSSFSAHRCLASEVTPIRGSPMVLTDPTLSSPLSPPSKSRTPFSPLYRNAASPRSSSWRNLQPKK